MNTTTGGTHQSLLKQYGQQNSGMIRNLLGTWQCQLLLPILLMATFKMGVNLLIHYNFEGNFLNNCWKTMLDMKMGVGVDRKVLVLH